MWAKTTTYKTSDRLGDERADCIRTERLEGIVEFLRQSRDVLLVALAGFHVAVRIARRDVGDVGTENGLVDRAAARVVPDGQGPQCVAVVRLPAGDELCPLELRLWEELGEVLPREFEGGFDSFGAWALIPYVRVPLLWPGVAWCGVYFFWGASCIMNMGRGAREHESASFFERYRTRTHNEHLGHLSARGVRQHARNLLGGVGSEERRIAVFNRVQLFDDGVFDARIVVPDTCHCGTTGGIEDFGAV